jgi:hypothetical protein
MCCRSRLLGKLFPVIFATFVFWFSSPALARQADCLFIFEGVTYINGPCKYTPKGNGSFRIDADGYAVQLGAFSGKGEGSWNGDVRASHLQQPLHAEGTLTRKGACWSNPGVRLCAWSGSRPGRKPTSPVRMQAKEYGRGMDSMVGSWSIVEVQKGGQMDHCYGMVLGDISRMQGNMKLSLNGHGKWQLSAPAAGKPKGYQGRFDIEYHKASGEIKGAVDPTGQRMNMVVSDEVLEGLKSAANVFFSYSNDLIYPLSQTARAIDKIMECLYAEDTHGEPVPDEHVENSYPAESDAHRMGEGCPRLGTVKSPGSNQPATIEFVNKMVSGRAAQIYWLDFNGNPVAYAIFDKDAITFDTYAGHAWIVKDFDGRCYGGVYTAKPGHNRVIVH